MFEKKVIKQLVVFPALIFKMHISTFRLRRFGRYSLSRQCLRFDSVSTEIQKFWILKHRHSMNLNLT